MRAPCPEAGILHDHPVALGHGFDARADGGYFETTFVAGYGRRLLGAEEGGEWGFGGVDALNLVYVCGVYGCGEGAEEEG